MLKASMIRKIIRRKLNFKRLNTVWRAVRFVIKVKRILKKKNQIAKNVFERIISKKVRFAISKNFQISLNNAYNERIAKRNQRKYYGYSSS